jgi:hypothetical protein
MIIARGFAIAAMLLTLAGQASAGEKKYGPGVTDSEITIGNTSPYSGPASAFSMVAKAGEAYVRKINAEGGINGRKIKFVSYDDAYSPPKTVEQTRKLVESDEVLFVFNAFRNISTPRRCRSCSSQAGRRSGTTRRIFHGRWDSPRATRMRGAPTPNIF